MSRVISVNAIAMPLPGVATMVTNKPTFQTIEKVLPRGLDTRRTACLSPHHLITSPPHYLITLPCRVLLRSHAMHPWEKTSTLVLEPRVQGCILSPPRS